MRVRIIVDVLAALLLGYLAYLSLGPAIQEVASGRVPTAGDIPLVIVFLVLGLGCLLMAGRLGWHGWRARSPNRPS